MDVNAGLARTSLGDTGRDAGRWKANDLGKNGTDEARPRDSEPPRNSGTYVPPELPDPRKLAQDWITLWQSELTAMASDPEMRESWQSAMGLWAGTMAAMLRGMPRSAPADGHDRTGGQARTADAARPAPAAAAPDARDAEIERLARHVAALERRLADIERVGDPPVDPVRRPRRGPRK